VLRGRCKRWTTQYLHRIARLLHAVLFSVSACTSPRENNLISLISLYFTLLLFPHLLGFRFRFFQDICTPMFLIMNVGITPRDAQRVLTHQESGLKASFLTLLLPEGRDILALRPVWWRRGVVDSTEV